MTAHAPHPPTDTLDGRWVIERAELGEQIEISGRPGAIWALTVRHCATAARDYVQCAALARTTFRVGQEITGRIVRRRDGEWFQRDRPAVARREL